MRHLPIYILLLFGIAAAAFMHTGKKVNANKDLALIMNGLRGIEEHLPMGTNVSARFVGVDNAPYLMCRYVLAPRYLSMDTAVQLDTSFLLCTAGTTDSAVKTLVDGQKVIWEHKDDRYHYFLTCNP